MAEDRIIFRCSCGARIAAKPEQSGNVCTCPSCGKSLKVPLTSQTSPDTEDTGENADVAEDRIIFRCPCGSKIGVPATDSGNVCTCPSCGESLMVPNPSTPKEETVAHVVPNSPNAQDGAIHGSILPEISWHSNDYEEVLSDYSSENVCVWVFLIAGGICFFIAFMLFFNAPDETPIAIATHSIAGGLLGAGFGSIATGYVMRMLIHITVATRVTAANSAREISES